MLWLPTPPPLGKSSATFLSCSSDSEVAAVAGYTPAHNAVRGGEPQGSAPILGLASARRSHRRPTRPHSDHFRTEQRPVGPSQEAGFHNLSLVQRIRGADSHPIVITRVRVTTQYRTQHPCSACSAVERVPQIARQARTGMARHTKDRHLAGEMTAFACAISLTAVALLGFRGLRVPAGDERYFYEAGFRFAPSGGEISTRTIRTLVLAASHGLGQTHRERARRYRPSLGWLC